MRTSMLVGSAFMSIMVAAASPASARQAQPVVSVQPLVIAQEDETMLVQFNLNNPFSERIIWVGYLSTGNMDSQANISTVLIWVALYPGQTEVLGPYEYPHSPLNYRLRPHGVALAYPFPQGSPGPTQMYNVFEQMVNDIRDLRYEHNTTRALIQEALVSLKEAEEADDPDAAAAMAAQMNSLESDDTATLQQIDNVEGANSQWIWWESAGALAIAGADGGVIWLDVVAFELGTGEDDPYVEISEEQEDTEGAIAIANTDDDNANDQPDSGETTVESENELLPAWGFFARPILPLMNQVTWGTYQLRSPSPTLMLWGLPSKVTTPTISVGGPANIQRVYVESTQPGSANLEGTLQGGPAAIEETVQYTGFGITTLTWLDAPNAGERLFTGGNFINPGGDRWHPDKLTPGAASSTGVYVRLRVRFTALNRWGIVSAKAFDVDDPSADENVPAESYLDEGTPDNLSTRNGRKEGFLRNSGGENNIAPVVVPGGAEPEVVLEFEPTHSPGDNFRIAVFLNWKDFAGLAVPPWNDPAASVHLAVPTPYGNAYVQLPTSGTVGFPIKQSALLTCWRFLHIEEDMQVNPAGMENIVEGAVQSTTAHPTYSGISIVTTNQYLDDNNQYGRLVQPPGPVGPILLPQGVLRVQVSGGGWRTFQTVGNTIGNALSGVFATVIVLNDAIGMPPASGNFQLQDDDSRTSAYQPATPYIQQIRTVFRDVYIEPLIDGGGDSAYNRSDLPFVRFFSQIRMGESIPSPTYIDAVTRPGAFQSGANRNPYYWVAYMQTYLQSSPGWDIDPDDQLDGDGATLAETPGHTFSFVFTEIIRDACLAFAFSAERTAAERAHTTPHELGHQFGLGEDDGNSVMGYDVESPNAYRFKSTDALRIRKAIVDDDFMVAKP